MLVPTVFQPATFFCGSRCSVPRSPWSTHLWGRWQQIPSTILCGVFFGGLPLGCEVGTLGVQAPPISSACPIHAVEGTLAPHQWQHGVRLAGDQVRHWVVWILCSGPLVASIQSGHGPLPALRQWEGNDNKMSRMGNPLRKHLHHMHLESLSGVTL